MKEVGDVTSSDWEQRGWAWNPVKTKFAVEAGVYKDIEFRINTEQWMVIVFMVKRRTSSLGIFGKAVRFKKYIFSYLFWNLIGQPVHTQKKANK